MSISTALRLAGAGCALSALILQSSPASADTTVSLTTDVRVGNSGTWGGTATFDRTMRADGTEVLLARAHVARPSVESSICLSPEAFRHRADWTACPNKTEQTTDVSYSLDLGRSYAGRVLHVQFRVRMQEFPNRPGEANGYAGWRPPSRSGGQHVDQYGEVALAAPAAAPSPSGSPSSSPSSSPSPTASPTASGSPGPSATPGTPSASPASPLPLPSGVEAASLAPTGVNAGTGGGAAPRSRALPIVLLLAGLGLTLVSGRRLTGGG